jgi:hypothetical protein
MRVIRPDQVEVHGSITTTSAFWDCECEDDYIHPVEEINCLRCGCSQDEQPDSILAEVIKAGLAIVS